MYYPMKMIPTFKNYLWGGERLTTDFNKKASVFPVAESWELCCHKDGESTIANGIYQNGLLSQVLLKLPNACGTKKQKNNDFPLLVKLIDAKTNLSIQVHPNDSYAKKHEGELGKTEMWVVLACAQNATLLYGLNQDITKEQLRRHIQENSLLDIMNSVPVSVGDVFFVPPGLLHAIGASILVAEIQQNSNTTYRVYDYNRKDTLGNTRELHIEKALDVAYLKQTHVTKQEQRNYVQCNGYVKSLLIKCDAFCTFSLKVSKTAFMHCNNESFYCLLCTQGFANIVWNGIQLPMQKGETAFIPAGLGEFQIDGKSEWLLATL